MKKSEQKMQDILSFIENYTKSYGYPPTYREISVGVKLKSINSIKKYLDRLENLGYISRKNFKSRSIELVKQKQETVNFPILGQVAAGQPILAEQNIENYLTISKVLIGNLDETALFALRVDGDSMIEAGINNGDLAIVHYQSSVENGEIAVVMVEDRATVKYFFKEKDKIILRPANELYKPIERKDNITIVGKVVAILRKI